MKAGMGKKGVAARVFFVVAVRGTGVGSTAGHWSGLLLVGR